MFAILEIGSHQYKIKEGDTIIANRLGAPQDGEVTLDKVLLIADGSNVKIGQPYLKNAKVTAKVVRDLKGPRTIAGKYRRRKDSSTRKGHRQLLTSLSIVKING